MVAAVLAATAACGAPAIPKAAAHPSAAGPGIDPNRKTITLLVLTDLSGPNRLLGRAVTAGQQAYFDRLNQSGGLRGWQVRLVIDDTRSEPSVALSDYRLESRRITFVAQSLGSAVTAAIQASAVADQVLVGTATRNVAFTRSVINAVLGPPYAADAANSLSLVPATSRVGLLYDADAYGQQVRVGFVRACAAFSLRDAGAASLPAASADFSRVLARLQRAGAGYVYLATTPTQTAAVQSAAMKLHFQPHWIIDERAWSPYLMSATGLAGGPPTPIAGELTGAWVVAFQAPWGALFAPGMSAFLSIVDQYAPAQVPDPNFIYGYALADMERKVLSSAIASGALTRRGILAAKRQFGIVDLESLLPHADYTAAGGPVTWRNDLYLVDPAAPGMLRLIAPYFESRATALLAGR
ncbi:MAG: ABC transporter substrate-binding protein [Mycobacteriales bacterium]